MTNLPQIAVPLPPITPLQNAQRSQQQIAAQRAQTSALIETVLDGYWQNDLSQKKRDLILMDWCDELEDWPVESIKAALRQWRRDNPNKKPNPGHILQILNHAWGERNAEKVRQATEEWERKLRASALPTEATATLTPEEQEARKAEAESKMADLLASLKAKSAQQEADDAARAQEARDSYKRFRPEAAE